MTLHLSETRPPQAGRVMRAKVIDAALCEAGYPTAMVSATDQGIGISKSYPECDEWGFQVAVARALALSARFDPDRADRLGGDERG